MEYESSVGGGIRLTVLDENHTYIEQFYLGEPAFSVLVEDGDEKILFDAGYSDVVIRNAETMGIDLNKLDQIALSHGHHDHACGLKYMLDDCEIAGLPLTACEGAFDHREIPEKDLSAPFDRKKAAELFDLRLTDRPVRLSEHIIFLGPVPRNNDFENGEPLGTVTHEDGISEPDRVLDDSSLVIETADGLFILTGCAHSGICNTIEYAKQVTGEDRIAGVLGGFHLFRTGHRIDETIRYFEENNVKELYPCHCANFKCRAAINEVHPVHEVGVGMKLELTAKGRSFGAYDKASLTD